MTPLIRRVLWIAAIVALLGLVAVLLGKVLAHSTIAFGEKCGAGNCWGYRLEQNRFSNRVVLTITRGSGMQLHFDLPDMLFERMSEDRWLAGDRAIYLNFRLKPVNVTGEAAPLRLIFDFQEGQLYINSPLQLSRSPDYRGRNPESHWIPEAEFQSVLTRIEP